MFRISQFENENKEFYEPYGFPFHCALDFPLPTGNPVYAVKSGVVYNVQTNPTVSNYGIHIRLLHEDGYRTIYAHLDSVNVVVNQQVSAGQIIGVSGNSGLSSGPHLHLELRWDNHSYTDYNGDVWPYSIFPCWQYLKRLYQNWLDENSITGYLYAPSLVLNLEGDYARCIGTLNIREHADPNSQMLGQTKYGTVVKILSSPINNYYQVQTPVDIFPTQPSNPFIGLHLRADPDMLLSSEWLEVDKLKSHSKAIKLLHAHPPNTFRLAGQHLGTNAKYIIRIFQSWGNRNITPLEFYNWNKDELIIKVNILKNEHGVNPSNIWIEYSNEPNLNIEGFDYSWHSGNEFVDWCNEGLFLFKANLTLDGVKWLYPGLSPGSYIPNIRYDSTAFLTESKNRGLSNFDYVGVHAYWSQNYSIQSAVNHIRQSQQIANKPVVITEASINDRPSVLSPAQYGQQYAQLVNLLKQESNVLGVLYFVSSASDPYFEPETWITESNQIKGIGQAMINSL